MLERRETKKALGGLKLGFGWGVVGVCMSVGEKGWIDFNYI